MTTRPAWPSYEKGTIVRITGLPDGHPEDLNQYVGMLTSNDGAFIGLLAQVIEYEMNEHDLTGQPIEVYHLELLTQNSASRLFERTRGWWVKHAIEPVDVNEAIKEEVAKHYGDTDV